MNFFTSSDRWLQRSMRRCLISGVVSPICSGNLSCPRMKKQNSVNQKWNAPISIQSGGSDTAVNQAILCICQLSIENFRAVCCTWWSNNKYKYVVQVTCTENFCHSFHQRSSSLHNLKLYISDINGFIYYQITLY